LEEPETGEKSVTNNEASARVNPADVLIHTFRRHSVGAPQSLEDG
jgi:hypothetical protein